VDCTDETGTRGFIDEVLRRWGRLDCLVFNAGSTSPVAFVNLTVAAWRENVDLNLNGAFIATHTAMPALTAHGGSIVLIGSGAVATGGGGRADYVSAKGVRCNVVHPSLIETELLIERYPDPARRAKAAQDVPVRRLGQPEDIANATVFLLSDRASYITGQALLVDGGRTFCR
jgi:NAD(P)-dependent dehydrogenase (short-subunit alcohol dehydrogenase family)